MKLYLNPSVLDIPICVGSRWRSSVVIYVIVYYSLTFFHNTHTLKIQNNQKYEFHFFTFFWLFGWIVRIFFLYHFMIYVKG